MQTSVIDLNPPLVVLELGFLLSIIKDVFKRKKVGALRVFSMNLLALEMAEDSLDVCNYFRSLNNADFCN